MHGQTVCQLRGIVLVEVMKGEANRTCEKEDKGCERMRVQAQS